jgi:hypothetical protein
VRCEKQAQTRREAGAQNLRGLSIEVAESLNSGGLWREPGVEKGVRQQVQDRCKVRLSAQTIKSGDRDTKENTVTNGTYNIEVRFEGGLTTAQEAAFTSAGDRWSQIISADVPRFRLNGEVVDDLLIFARGSRIDGPSGILGQAAPTRFRPGSLIPATGFMEFDTADLARMELDGSLEAVIFHEMGHVCGIGTSWRDLGLLEGAGTANPVFTGENAMREFAALIGADEPTPVPVANRGGPGTRDAHWREEVFANELMTGFLDLGSNPVSRVTVASVQDLGYEVDFAAAEDFALPSFLELSLRGIGVVENTQGCMMAGLRRRGLKPEVLPESALL